MIAAPSEIAVTVVICTHQRAATLRDTLESVVEQARAADADVLVVDNGSTDSTAALVQCFGAVRYVREENLGLCHARNRGWREARGDVIAFLDDDAVAAPGWLDAVREAFVRADPTVGCVGGAVLPDWETPPPTWLSRDVALGLAIVDWPGGAQPITNLSEMWLAGANLACRVVALEAVGGFHPWLDRRGARLLSSGDVFLARQLIKRGYSCVYEPAMRVYHRIPVGRLTRSWFRRRYFWQGVSNALMNVIEGSPSGPQRARDALALGGTLLQRPAHLATLLRDTEDPREFEEQCWTWIEVGHVAGLLGAAGR